MYIEDGRPVNRERFFEICGELGTAPIYGLRPEVSPVRSSDAHIAVTAGALVIPRLSENNKKFGRYLIENYKHDAADMDRRFLTLFTERMGH